MSSIQILNNNKESNNNAVITYRNQSGQMNVETENRPTMGSLVLKTIIYSKENSDLETIKSKLDDEKNKIDINKDVDFNTIFSQFIMKIIKYYNIASKDINRKQLVIDELLSPYFEDILINENYVDNFSDKQIISKIDKSILYKKNVVEKGFYDAFWSICINPFYFCKEKEDNKFNPFIHNYNLMGIKIISFIISIFSILFSIFAFFIYFKTLISKTGNFLDKFTKNNIGNEILEFYSNEYKCISLEISDLMNKDYSFTISCTEGRQFYYISKFGISPINEEGENIAGCFSKSFKNLIMTDTKCDLSNYLNEQLSQYKFKEGNITINDHNMNISNQILNNCTNENKRTKFFLSYSCYIPYFKKKDINVTRKDFVMPAIYLGTFSLILIYILFFFIDYHFLRL